jgi:hypothetical protein
MRTTDHNKNMDKHDLVFFIENNFSQQPKIYENHLKRRICRIIHMTQNNKEKECQNNVINILNHVIQLYKDIIESLFHWMDIKTKIKFANYSFDSLNDIINDYISHNKHRNTDIDFYYDSVHYLCTLLHHYDHMLL